MGDSGIRVGDIERDLAAKALREHLEAGRLNPGEHEERCANATVARTKADIEALFTDLPAPHPDLSKVVAPATDADSSELADALGGVGCLLLIGGIAASVVFTTLFEMWWTFLVTGGVVTVLWTLSGVAEHRHTKRQLSRTGHVPPPRSGPG